MDFIKNSKTESIFTEMVVHTVDGMRHISYRVTLIGNF